MFIYNERRNILDEDISNNIKTFLNMIGREKFENILKHEQIKASKI